MSDYQYCTKCSLIVSTSDAYKTSWYPYFELVKKFWPNHPRKIYLNSETKEYHDETLNIINVLGGKKSTWSERLYRCLERIDTDYIIFSLEDFFLLGPVKDEIIEQCISTMEDKPEIAEFRLKSSNLKCLRYEEKYGNFRIAENDTPYRLDTQVAIWRRETLMRFIDLSENPWEFEEIGTRRIMNSHELFLWFYSEKDDALVAPFPYNIEQWKGYGIAWGKWLWNNKTWFEKNNINNVNFHELGVLPHWAFRFRWNYLYRAGKPKAKGIMRIVQRTYKLVVRIEKGITFVRINGVNDGLIRIIKRRC